MGLIAFTPAKKANPYAADIQSLKDLGVPTPEGQAWDVENVARDAVDKVRVKFGEGARDAGYTARFRGTKDNEDGTVNVIFTARVLDASRERGKGAKAEDVKPENKPAPKPGK